MQKKDENEELIQQVKQHFRANRLRLSGAIRDIQLKIGDSIYLLTAGEAKFIVLRFQQSLDASPDFKFHINVAPEDLETAWAITAVTCAQSKYSGMKVFSTQPEGDEEQKKKPITIYARPKNEADKHIHLLMTIEKKFKEAGIKPLPEEQLSHFDAKLVDDQNMPLVFVTYRREDGLRRNHYVPNQNDRFYPFYRVGDVIIPDSNEGRLPLHYAAAYSAIPIIPKIITKPSVKTSLIIPDDKGQIPLHVAVLNQNLMAVEQLLTVDPKSQVNYADHLGCSPLHYATTIKLNIDILLKLLSIAGVDMELRNNKGKTPFMLALLQGSWAAIKLLLSAGAQDNPESTWIATSLWHRACLEDQRDIIKKNLRLCSVQDERGRTFLHYAAKGAHDELINFLLKAAPTRFCKDIYGMLPLHIAAKKCSGATVKLLIQSLPKGEINTQDAKGRTALHYAAGRGNKEATRELLSVAETKFLRDKNGMTPFHAAAKHKHPALLRVLLEKVAGEQLNYLNQRDQQGKTPLHYAAASGDVQTIKSLLRHGADPKAIDNTNNMPWHYVQSNPELVKLLGGPRQAEKPVSYEVSFAQGVARVKLDIPKLAIAKSPDDQPESDISKSNKP